MAMIDGKDLGKRIEKKAADKLEAEGRKWLGLAGESADHFERLVGNAAGALAGNERAEAHLKAQVAQLKFSTEVEGYLSAKELQEAILETIAEVAEESLDVAVEAAGAALAGLLKSSFAAGA